MRLIIAGGRDFDDYDKLKKVIVSTGIWEATKGNREKLVIVCGEARGADKLGRVFAERNNLQVASYPADWELYGKSAGYKRNEQMAKNADALLAFWDGKSRGTKHMIDLATRHGLTVYVIPY